MITLAVLLSLAFSLSAPALAADRYSMEPRGKESDQPYTFGDLAAARLAVYGWLDERYRTPQPETSEPVSRLEAVRLLWRAFAAEEVNLCSTRQFSDVPAGYEEPVTWAVEHGIAQGITTAEFGAYPVSETAFVTMLLHALGWQGRFAHAHALDFAESSGLAPPGLSRNFTLGDAALYLQSAVDIQLADGTAARERMNIPVEKNQTTFPDCVILTPLNPEDAEAQIQEATRYLASIITVQGDFLGKDAMLALYQRYSDASGAPWYISRTSMEYGVLADMEMMDTSETSPEQHEFFKAFSEKLWRQYETGALTSQEHWSALNMKRMELFSSGKSLMLTTRYNEAWELACDLDDAFILYEDDSVTEQADRFYRRYMSRAETDREKVRAAQFAVGYKAEYAPAAGHSEEGPFYAPEAHSIEGFFKSGRIVCDGYASVFQYLMIRSGMECVVVTGSTKSGEAAENEQTDHAWNKVLVDGTWLNVDTCWNDTGWPDTYYLKTDDYYANHRHWAVTYRGL